MEYLKGRAMWRDRIERLMATDMSTADWCRANRVSESALYGWVANFAETEPDVFGGRENVVDRSQAKWLMKTRENMRRSVAIEPARPVAAEPFVRVCDLGAAAPAAVAPGARPITVAAKGMEVRIPPGSLGADIAAVLGAVASL